MMKRWTAPKLYAWLWIGLAVLYSLSILVQGYQRHGNGAGNDDIFNTGPATGALISLVLNGIIIIFPAICLLRSQKTSTQVLLCLYLGAFVPLLLALPLYGYLISLAPMAVVLAAIQHKHSRRSDT